MRVLHAAGAAAALAVALTVPAPAHAQARVQFGPQFSVSDDQDFGVGAGLRWELLPDDRRLALVASFDYFFPDEEVEFDEFLEPGPLRDFFELFGDDLPIFDLLDLEREYWEANLNLTWDFTSSGTVIPYAGVGGTYGRSKISVLGFDADEDDAGANVLAGVRIARRVFVEAKREAGGGELFVVTAGVRF